MSRTRLRLGVAVASVALLSVSACSSDSKESGDGGGGGTSGPVELSFWTWAPNMDKVVEAWNADNPDIKVTVTKVDAGDAAVTKLLTAIKAGKGAPDIMQAEYQKVPTLVSNEALADISEHVDDAAVGEFSDGVVNAMTLGSDALYGLPQDTGPLAFYYRADVFEKLGLEVPTTWDEYAETARAVRKADPNVYLGTFSSNDPGWFTGLTQQAGASWWGTDGDAWSVAIDDEPTQRVAEYWGGLVEEGVINNKPMYTPEWNEALNTGKEIGWVSAVWAPGVLAGNAPKTEGKWKIAPMPTWDGEEGNGAWGGSATSVTSQSEHPAEAAEFITWLNTDPEAVQGLIDQAGIYPAASAGQDLMTEPPAFFSNQPEFYDIAAEASAGINPFTYGPNVNVTYSTYNDAFGAAAESRSQADFLAAVTELQDATVANLEETGFAVAE